MTGNAGPADRWAALHSDHLTWAYRAYRRFIDALSDDVRSHFVANPAHEPYVVVFGKSQVGKTTLVLELMGVQIEAQAQVGRVLRGGRPAGNSATATTMEYRRAPDDAWRIDEGAGVRVLADDDAMCAALADLRLRMTKRRLNAEHPVRVAIPAKYFDQNPNGLRTRMLDLPGDNPADALERAHVTEMAQRYVPHADLILLIGLGDQLSFLNPATLKLPGIEDWQYVPNRFRIITTYAYRPESVRNFVNGTRGTLKESDVTERLIEQLGTFGRTLSPDAVRLERFFPLEIGDSWEALLTEDTAFRHRVEPVIRSSKARLLKHIRGSATEAARFRNAIDVHMIAKRKRAVYIAAARTAYQKLGSDIARTASTAKQATDCGKDAAAALADVRKVLAQRASAEKAVAAMPAFDAAGYIATHDWTKTNTASLFTHIGDVTELLGRHFLGTAPAGKAVRAFFGTSFPTLTSQLVKVRRIADDQFGTIITRLASHTLTEYYPRLSNSFATDTAQVRQDIHDAATKTARMARSLWRKHLDKRIDALQADEAEQDGLRAGFEKDAKRLWAKHARLTEEAAGLKANLKSALARLKRDTNAATRFEIMLDEEYLAELQQKQAHLAQADRPVDALLMLLSIADIGAERRKINLAQLE
jgi:IS1 family transposase